MLPNSAWAMLQAPRAIEAEAPKAFRECSKTRAGTSNSLPALHLGRRFASPEARRPTPPSPMPGSHVLKPISPAWAPPKTIHDVNCHGERKPVPHPIAFAKPPSRLAALGEMRTAPEGAAASHQTSPAAQAVAASRASARAGSCRPSAGISSGAGAGSGTEPLGGRGVPMTIGSAIDATSSTAARGMAAM